MRRLDSYIYRIHYETNDATIPHIPYLGINPEPQPDPKPVCSSKIPFNSDVPFLFEELINQEFLFLIIRIRDHI